jgi:hypothetical protein
VQWRREMDRWEKACEREWMKLDLWRRDGILEEDEGLDDQIADEHGECLRNIRGPWHPALKFQRHDVFYVCGTRSGALRRYV